MEGVRLKDTKALAESQEWTFKTVVLMLTIDAVRYITCFYLKASKLFFDPCRPYPIFDLTNPTFSQVVLAAQYLSWLVSGKALKLNLVWAPYGDMQQFARAEPAKWKYARGVFFATAGSFYRRNKKTIKAYGRNTSNQQKHT